MNELIFSDYHPSDRPTCSALFERNCPAYFAIEERSAYQAFLEAEPKQYWLAWTDNVAVACYGVTIERDVAGIDWIMVDPSHQSKGVGDAMVKRAFDLFNKHNVKEVKVATSQHANRFFERYGLVETSTTLHGWGQGMHKIDMVMSL